MLETPELQIAQNLPPAGCSAVEAERYTRWLATHHYENFNVVSRLLPRELHQHFYNVYAYCRWSDDLGDEVASPQRAIELLDAWEVELNLIFSNSGASKAGPTHPVLIALAETIRAKQIPIAPFSDLLKAFRQDQTVRRYATWDDVYHYCEYSANPVGRLVLYLSGYRDEPRQTLSDATCTALQLANFWQDVSRDLEKGRIYVPLEALAKHRLTEADIVNQRFDARYVALMKDLIARTRELFHQGMPLSETVAPFLRVDLEMFSRGGLAILDAIESSGFDTLNHRPSLSKWTQVKLLGRTLLIKTFGAKSEAAKASAAPPDNVTPMRAPTSNPSASDFLPSTAPAKHEPYTAAARESHAECNRIARASKSSFYLAFYGLRKEKRNALCALYAF